MRNRVCGLLLVWFVAWTPYAALSMWAMVFEVRGLSLELAIIPAVCCKGSAAANAMFYGLR